MASAIESENKNSHPLRAGIEENSTLMNSRTVAKKNKGKLHSFLTFLYDRQHGTCLGRTAKSWLQITVFYIIFYSCLAAFWMACLAVFIKTLDDKVPRYYGKGTIIGINPGMGYQPWLKTDPDSTLIRFNIKDPNSYKKYVNTLNSYLSKYENTNGTRDCSGKESNKDDSELACQFKLNEIVGKACSAENDYGYATGEPCVALSLNRLIGWNPVEYPANSVPEVVRDHDRYQAGSIAVHCDGEYEPDAEHVGKVTYLPPHGIDGKYFPYKVMENYHQPIAMVKFNNAQRNKVILIECRAYAYNIIHDSADRLGLVHFELLIENNEPTTTTTDATPSTLSR
jgi:sodium/potassium-transporting ATPase subunit beta